MRVNISPLANTLTLCAEAENPRRYVDISNPQPGADLVHYKLQSVQSLHQSYATPALVRKFSHLFLDLVLKLSKRS